MVDFFFSLKLSSVPELKPGQVFFPVNTLTPTPALRLNWVVDRPQSLLPLECPSNPELQALGPVGPSRYCSFPCCANTPLYLRAGQLWAVWPSDWIFKGAQPVANPLVVSDLMTAHCPLPVSLLLLWPLSSKLLISGVSFLGKPKQRNSLIQVVPDPLPLAPSHTLHKFFLTYLGSCSQSCPGPLWHLPFEPVNARLRVITQALAFCIPPPNQKMNCQKSRVLFHVALFSFLVCLSDWYVTRAEYMPVFIEW